MNHAGLAARSSLADELQSACLQDLARWVDEKPDGSALLGAGHPAVSFVALATRIAAVAKTLRAAGVKPGDVVAVAMPDGPGLFSTLLGAVAVAAAAPLDWQLTPVEFHSRLTLLAPSVLLVRSASDGHAAVVARDIGIPVLELDFRADGNVSLGSATLPDVSARTARAPEQSALILQTSATTGEPKLVPLSHRNLYAMCEGVTRCLALRADDRYLSIMPLHHILGFSSALGQLMAGGSVACTGFDALKFPAWIEELSPTWYAAGPALHRAILDIARQDPGPFRRSRLRFVRCGSGAGSPTLLNDIEAVLGVIVVNGYGLTEVGPATNTAPGAPRKTGSVGRTIGPEIAIMDGLGNLLAVGTEGEVVLRGDAVMDGYLGDERANREAFRDGWFRTGDLGRLDRDGDLFITGRIKEIINRGGETISPLEIDHALAEHPSVFRTASFGVPHPTLNEDIVAAVVLRPGARAAGSEIRNFLAGRLSRSKIPGRLWFLESIPLSASGKPLRDTLRTQFEASARSQAAPESTTLEDESTSLLRGRIAAVWMRVLDSDLPQADDNFFGMGGDSFSATRLFAVLQEELELGDAPLDIPKFLDSPTFFQLVQMVRETALRQTAPDAPAGVRFEDVSALCLQPSGDGPALFFFPSEASEPWYLRHLARSLGDKQPFFALRHHLTDAADFPRFADRFVTLISRIRPAGPLVLAGHCYGGILAYEVAQRLLGMSRSDFAVVLVDVGAPGYPKPRVSTYMTRLPNALGSVMRGGARKLLAELVEHLRFLRALRSRKSKAKEVLSAARAEAAQKAEVPGLTPGAVVMSTYVPRPFTGPLVNILAADLQVQERVLEDSRKGWRELARGPFQEGSISGHHESVFHAENAPALARFIESSLERLGVTSRPAVL